MKNGKLNQPEDTLAGGEAYNLPPVLTVDEVAEFLRLNRKTVFASIAAGKMPGRKVGRRIVVLRDALLQWMRSNEHALSSKMRRR